MRAENKHAPNTPTDSGASAVYGAALKLKSENTRLVVIVGEMI